MNLEVEISLDSFIINGNYTYEKEETNMNKIVSGIIKGAVVATVGFIVGITVAEKQSRKETKTEEVQ